MPREERLKFPDVARVFLCRARCYGALTTDQPKRYIGGWIDIREAPLLNGAAADPYWMRRRWIPRFRILSAPAILRS